MVATREVRKPVSVAEAERLGVRGTNFFGPKQILEVHGELHGIKVPVESELPPMPWTDEEIKEAFATGHHLVLVAPGLIMKELMEKRRNKATDGGKLLYDTTWYQNEPFFTTDTTGKKWDWRLVNDEPLPGSTGKNFLQQIQALAEEIKRIFVGREMPAAYRQAIAELEAKQDKLAKLMEDDWREAAKELSTLQLNQFCRETPVLTFYRLVTYEVVNHERLLQGIYHWSSALSSRGGLVYVGYFGRAGADCDDWDPRYSNDGLGVVFSRSALVEDGKW